MTDDDISARSTAMASDTMPERSVSDAVLSDALQVIDDALSTMMSRDLVSSGEVADVLLDVRSLLTTPAERV